MPSSPSYKTRKDGIVVPARSKANIAENAMVLRRVLGLESLQRFPVVEVYEGLDLIIPGARFEVREEWESGEDHGRTYSDRNLIFIREDVYIRACNDEARDRFTMCHELGHLLMHRNVALSRIDPRNPPKIFRNSEWQADTFASHLMMPAHLLRQHSTVNSVMASFGVSQEAAWARRDELKNA